MTQDVGERAFARLYGLLVAGDRGVIDSDALVPVRELPSLDDLDDAAGAVDRVVMIRLNGGLGTTMGLSAPKSLVEVKPGVTFLDVIAAQARAAGVSLVLMNSPASRAPSLAALARHGRLSGDLPPDFLQHREPRLRAADLQPLDDWCPPGHGDLYAALYASGMLGELLARGFRYAFVANADNLGAVVEPRIPAWMAREELPFVMEVVEGTAADRKGGHVALHDGRLILRDTAQAPDDGSFTDYERWRFYNTNNLWLDLERLAALLDEHDGVLPLPLIVNRKGDAIQLETAMGSAIGVIDGARALRVPRTRFAPVKSTDDLLLVRSDAYELGADASLRLVGEATVVTLDRRYFGSLADLDRRCPFGPPSLRRCTSLTVRGDLVFARGLELVGDVVLEGADAG